MSIHADCGRDGRNVVKQNGEDLMMRRIYRYYWKIWGVIAGYRPANRKWIYNIEKLTVAPMTIRRCRA